MAYLLTLVLSFVPLILKKILALLGVGLVTYVGADFLVGQLTTLTLQHYNNLGTDVLLLADLAGVHVGIKMMLATYAGLVTLKAVQKSTNIVMGAK